MAPAVAPPAPDAEQLMVTWLEPDQAQHQLDEGHKRLWHLRSATYHGRGAWTQPVQLFSGTQLMANWADTPGAVVGGDGRAWSHHLERSGGAGSYAYHVILQQRTDHDQNVWARLGPAHEDRTDTEHGFVSYAVGRTGVQVFWLDGRNMTASHGDDDAQGAMTLRTRALGPGLGQMSDETLLDERVCECCATDAAMTEDGPIVVYRDRSQSEVRDIACVRLVNGAWTAPASVHHDGWMIPGCPVNGPAIAARGRTILVGWYTGADNRGRIEIAVSHDAGATFGTGTTIDGPDDGGRNAPDGRVDVAVDPAGRYGFVLWLDRPEKDETIDLTDDETNPADYAGELDGVIRLAMIDLERGTVLDTRAITRTSAARSSGFPKLAPLDDDRLVIIWTKTTIPHGLAACEIGYSAR